MVRHLVEVEEPVRVSAVHHDPQREEQGGEGDGLPQSPNGNAPDLLVARPRRDVVEGGVKRGGGDARRP